LIVRRTIQERGSDFLRWYVVLAELERYYKTSRGPAAL
jgi:hypothetical protein